MRVGIITITEGQNYGNRLQNYAVQCIMRKNKCSPETLHNYKDWNICSYLLKNKLRYFVKRLLGRYDENELVRKKKFEQFNNKFLIFSKYYISNININKKINSNYDYFICGSDQIWNSNFKENGFVNFLQFADEKKRIAFAPSFGTSEINENYKFEYSKWLKSIPYLSVRENRGKEIIEELTGRTDVEVLVDPTMLLTAEEWDKVSKKPEQLKSDKYILNYFLGELSEERKNEIERIARENDCEVINILDKNSSFYRTGPSEFLYLEKNAFLICTDSFHSCVFAILYDRPFIIFDREDKLENMNSRIDTLIHKFELTNRKFEDKITEENLQHDYTKVYEILEEEREKANLYLRKALNINNEEKSN